MNDSNRLSTTGEVELQTIIQDMERYIHDIRHKLSEALKETERTQKALEYQHQMSKAWDEKARFAEQSGRTDLTQEAQEHRRRHDNYASEIEQEWQRVHSTASRYKSQLSSFEMKIEAAKVRIELLWARRQHAQIQKSVEAPTAKLALTIDRFERLMSQIEVEMDLDQELRVSGPQLVHSQPPMQADELAKIRAFKNLKPLYPSQVKER